MKTILDSMLESPSFRKLIHESTAEAFKEGRLEFNSETGWQKAFYCPDINANFNLYRIINPHNKTAMNTIKDGNPPSHLSKCYTKELHLQHVQAYWDGNLEQFCPIDNSWKKADEPPYTISPPENYRIKQPQQLRPWKPEEIPLGAWVREKGSTGTSLIVASIKGCAVWLHEIDEEFYKTAPTHLLSSFEHSTDQGKTWLPCGVLE